MEAERRRPSVASVYEFVGVGGERSGRVEIEVPPLSPYSLAYGTWYLTPTFFRLGGEIEAYEPRPDGTVRVFETNAFRVACLNCVSDQGSQRPLSLLRFSSRRLSSEDGVIVYDSHGALPPPVPLSINVPGTRLIFSLRPLAEENARARPARAGERIALGVTLFRLREEGDDAAIPR